MSEQYWRRQAEAWRANYDFLMQEIERASILYNNLLEQFEELKRELNDCRNKATKDRESGD